MSEREGGLTRLAQDGVEAIESAGLFGRARARCKEFLDVLVDRAPEDDRLLGLRPNDDAEKGLGQNVSG